MKKNIDGSKTAGQEMKEKQSMMDKASNEAKKENYTTNTDDTKNRNRRDHSEKRGGKGSVD
jgi:hypothetical protein